MSLRLSFLPTHQLTRRSNPIMCPGHANG
uniref:Uncharacterized protein n=1 Tax=Solanum lycopersicum TaxID=4081 RepID=K4BD65_SOLLC